MIGQTIGGYEILDVLGRGGMGVVFKAVDTALDKVVALKALDPVHAQSEQFLGRFRIEARTLGRLQHPHIVNVFAFRHVEPHLFIVMEYVDGGSVADLIAERGAVPWKEALPIIRQSLQATVFAHRANVVHRDIKPRNILLTRSGAVKVTDFGLAKIQEATGEGHGLTRTGITGGTLYYMPPEQLEGLNRVDHRGDIYSLGMSCYELLAGRVPFDKQQSEFSILKAIDAHSFPPLYTFAPDVPRPLAEIVTKALEYDPADRFQSANAMLEALDAWTAGDEKTVLAPADDATQVFGWAAPPPTPSDVRSSEEALAGDESTPGKNAPGAERQEENRGDSSSLLKSLKLLLKDRSGNWRVSGAPAGEGEAEPLDSGEQVDPALQATAIASAPLKVSKPLAEESRRPRTERPRKRARARATPPETASAPRRRPHPLLLAAGVAALLAVAFLFYPDGEGEEAEAPAALSIRTDPGGASVSLGGQAVGTTPLLNLEASAGTHRLRITKSGFAALDTSVVLEAGAGQAFTFALSTLRDSDVVAERPVSDPASDDAVEEEEGVADEPAFGAVTLRSDPSGAEVWLDGQRLGTTPYTARELAPGTHRFGFRKDGYGERSASVRVEAGRTTTAAATLSPLRGTLRVLVRPYGDIYVDGEVKRRATNAVHTEELPAGDYRVRAVHPALGTWEKTVSLGGGAREELIFNFNQTFRLTVVSEPRNASIVVDGEPVGRNTPSQVALRPGRHTVEVRKDGYVMAGRPQTITLEGDRTDRPLSFELRER